MVSATKKQKTGEEEERCLDPHHQPVGQIDNLFVEMLSSDTDTEPRSPWDTRRAKSGGREENEKKSPVILASD